MKLVVLKDGTRIENCADGTTANTIMAIRDSYGNAGAVRDLFNADNTKVLKIYDVTEEGEEFVTTSANRVLVGGTTITEGEDGFVCAINTREKSITEKMQDEIAELQEAILG